MNIALIVTDAGPLITLAVADAILNRATGVRGSTARVAGAIATRGGDDVLKEWIA